MLSSTAIAPPAISNLFHSVDDNCTDGDIRLVGGTTDNEGRVEICSDRRWGTICDDGWDSTDAGVVCRQLGYSPLLEHLAVHEAFFGAASGGLIHLSEVSCVGNESSIANCLYDDTGNCLHDEDAGVVCTGEPLPFSPLEICSLGPLHVNIN